VTVHNEWTWVGGSDVFGAAGIYGTQGAAAASNVPGARQDAVSWKDVSGNLWLFGGLGIDSTGNLVSFNDLWEYGGSEWIWMGGSNDADQPGSYGIQGTSAASNTPGARSGAATWSDGAGNLWLFGGFGFDPTNGDYSDLWKYSAGEWTWVGGWNVTYQPGSYGTLGVASSGNLPGARYSGVSWTDAAGNFWLFGGNGRDSISQGDLNDLWRYNPNSGDWAWMGGSNLSNQPGTYGKQGTPDPSNDPGARDYAMSWTDASGDLWLFGGIGYDSTGKAGYLNDLWKYSLSTGEWAWMGGSQIVNQQATYGTQGTASSSNIPQAVGSAIGWTDTSGDFWFFGGYGENSTGITGSLGDLWKYNPGTGEWTWMGGSGTLDQSGTFGTQGTASSGNLPGSRYGAASWTDAAGNLWLFGGVGFGSHTTGSGELNDLWEYQP
jgi:N-acetylneuraminic acid mutarotase